MSALQSLLLAILTLLILLNVTTQSPTPIGHRTPERRTCEKNAAGEWVCNEQLPTIKDFTSHMTDQSIGGNIKPKTRIMFWTNIGTWQQTRPWFALWIARHDWGLAQDFCFIYSVFDTGSVGKNWYNRQGDWARGKFNELGALGAAQYFNVKDPWTNKYLDGTQPEYYGLNVVKVVEWCFYQALAAATQYPDVYLFTKSDEDWPEDKVWAKVEFWALTYNPNVQNIWRVDPRPEKRDDCGDAPQSLLWTRDHNHPDKNADTLYDEQPRRWSCDDYVAAGQEEAAAAAGVPQAVPMDQDPTKEKPPPPVAAARLREV